MVIVPRGQVGGLFEDLISAGQSFVSQQVVPQIGAAAASVVRQQVAANIKQAAFYSAYSQPVVYSGQAIGDLVSGRIKELSRPSSGPRGTAADRALSAAGSKTLIERVKPTIVIEGSFGRTVIAPYGEATPGEWRTNVSSLIVGVIGVLALYTAGSYYLGYKAGQRSRA
jgi:hypothetical protein